jgi:hypothetical protein
MEKGMPHVATTLECPKLKQERQIEFDVNVFRSADHRGVNVTTCSEFLHAGGLPTCGQDCVHSSEARKVHEKEVDKHLADLAQIGRNIIG